MPRIILQTRFTDDTVQHEYDCGDLDLNAALGWAVRNWHPAQGPASTAARGSTSTIACWFRSTALSSCRSRLQWPAPILRSV